MRDHAPMTSIHQPSRRGPGRALPNGAGMILALIGWGIFVLGIIVGLGLASWVF